MHLLNNVQYFYISLIIYCLENNNLHTFSTLQFYYTHIIYEACNQRKFFQKLLDRQNKPNILRSNTKNSFEIRGAYSDNDYD
jgi:hypothetical protein